MSQKEKFARKIKNCRLVLHQNLQDNTRSHHRYVVLKMWINSSEVLVRHTIHTVELPSMLWQAGSAHIVGNEYIMSHEMNMAICQSPNFILPCIGKGLSCVSVSRSWVMSRWAIPTWYSCLESALVASGLSFREIDNICRFLCACACALAKGKAKGRRVLLIIIGLPFLSMHQCLAWSGQICFSTYKTISMNFLAFEACLVCAVCACPMSLNWILTLGLRPFCPSGSFLRPHSYTTPAGFEDCFPN